MTTRRTTKEQLDKIMLKQEQMKEREKMLKKRLAQEERKARTKRLIQIGAEVESVYGKPIEEDKLLLLRKFLLEQEQRGKYFSKALAEDEYTKDN